MVTIQHFIIGIIVLGVLVIIHELGHFLAAKACGIRVLSFSIGFGKVIFRKKVNGTEYRVSAIPFGGYVHMKGEHPEDQHEASDDEFSSKPIWQRAIVAFAGPFANIIISFIIIWSILLVGFDRIENMTIGQVNEGSPAFNAGLQTGDSLISINGVQLKSWEDFFKKFVFEDSKYSITFTRNEKRHNATISNVKINHDELDLYGAVGIVPKTPARIGKVQQNMPAERVGMQPNDEIVEINNIKITSWNQFSKIVSNFSPDEGKLEISLRRKDTVISINVEPVYNKEANRYLLGVERAPMKMTIIKHSPISAFPRAFEISLDYITMIFKLLPKLFKMRKQLAGPVGIMQMSGKVALISFVGLLNFIALIGINLGVLNLLPLIITDGGVIFFLIIESIRKKPLSLKAQLVLNKIAIAFFIVLFVYVTKNDILRFFTQ